MAIITISAIELGPEFVSGIPRYVALETNVPSTVFYTVDGSEPTTQSFVYIEPVLLPDGVCSITFRAKAISGADVGYLYVVFGTDNTDIVRTRRIEGYGAGFVIDAYGKEWVFYDGYSVDKNDIANVPGRFSDYPETYVDNFIIYSETGVNGIGSGEKPFIGPTPEDVTKRSSAIGIDESSPNEKNVFFDPKAMYIVIDGTMADGYVDQAVFPINRPLDGTMDMTKYMGGQTLRRQQPFISGGLVRSFVNPKEGTLISYYFDNCEGRWIRSKQKYDTTKVPDGIASRRQFGPPLIFKWVYNKGSMI
jgi:hypothetical protein